MVLFRSAEGAAGGRVDGRIFCAHFLNVPPHAGLVGSGLWAKGTDGKLECTMHHSMCFWPQKGRVRIVFLLLLVQHNLTRRRSRLPFLSPPRQPWLSPPTLASIPSSQMALQNPGDRRLAAMPMLKDMRSEDSTSTSSLTFLDRKGLVSLHRAKYSPRHPGPGVTDSNGLDA